MGRLKDETLAGAKWQLLHRFTMQPVQMIYGVILARLITPEEMGVLGLTAIFFALAAVLQSSGIGVALIRKIDRTEEDINTAFWFNIAGSLLFASIFWFSAPWLAYFFEQPDLLWITRISSIMMFVTSSAGTHWLLYTCRRDFKTPAIVGFITTVLGMPVTITLAFLGWSYWSIVWSGVFTSVLSLIIAWRISPWRPKLQFSTKSFKNLFGFGSKMMASALLDEGFKHIRTFIIGKFYSTASLGLYSKANSMANLPVSTINGILGGITYPILATVQDDDKRLLSAYKKYIKIASFGIFWGVLLMAALAYPLVSFLYGENWLGCVIYAQIICLYLCFYHIHEINLKILMVKGRSDLFLRLEIIKKIVVAIALIITAPISIEAMCWAGVVTSQLALFINTYYTGKLFNYSIKAQWKDFLPYLLCAAISCTPAYLITFTSLPDYAQLIAGGGLSSVIYYLLNRLRRDEAMQEIIDTMEEKGVFRKLKKFCPFVK